MMNCANIHLKSMRHVDGESLAIGVERLIRLLAQAGTLPHDVHVAFLVHDHRAHLHIYHRQAIFVLRYSSSVTGKFTFVIPIKSFSNECGWCLSVCCGQSNSQKKMSI